MLPSGEAEDSVLREYSFGFICAISPSIQPRGKRVFALFRRGVLFFLLHILHQPDPAHRTANPAQASGLFFCASIGTPFHTTVFALHLSLQLPDCIQYGDRRSFRQQ